MKIYISENQEEEWRSYHTDKRQRDRAANQLETEGGDISVVYDCDVVFLLNEKDTQIANLREIVEYLVKWSELPRNAIYPPFRPELWNELKSIRAIPPHLKEWIAENQGNW